MSEYHTPVLLKESVGALVGNPDGVYADATFGGGGHSSEILKSLSSMGRLIAFDRDPDALANASEAIRRDQRLVFVHDNFRWIHNYSLWYFKDNCTSKAGQGEDNCSNPAGLDGVLADLGVSSHQFDTAERGFSFRYDAPLDMRMDQEKGELTAAAIVNEYDEARLAEILDIYGEVQGARKMAALIAKARGKARIETTVQLNEAIAPMLPKFAEHKALAKVYQALRIEVNSEMRSLEKFLEGATAALKPGGKLVIITYHSLEDRMVKNYIKAGNVQGAVQKDLYGNSLAPLCAVNTKPILPEEAEIALNTRARSAKLRIGVKI